MWQLHQSWMAWQGIHHKSAHERMRSWSHGIKGDVPLPTFLMWVPLLTDSSVRRGWFSFQKSRAKKEEKREILTFGSQMMGRWEQVKGEEALLPCTSISSSYKEIPFLFLFFGKKIKRVKRLESGSLRITTRKPSSGAKKVETTVKPSNNTARRSSCRYELRRSPSSFHKHFFVFFRLCFLFNPCDPLKRVKRLESGNLGSNN